MRFLPPKSMVEVTVRTVHGRMLLRPSAVLNDLAIGVIGRAQRVHSMTVHAVSVLSNHLHLDLSPDSPQQLAAFMEFVNGNLAKEAGRLHDWREKFWSRRYRAIAVSDEEDAQVERLTYVLANGVKEGLVERPQDWPGVQCAQALLDGTDLEGTWFDRTAEYRARQRGVEVRPGDFAQRERIVFTPLPCWASLEPVAYRSRVAELIAQIGEAARRERSGRAVLGRGAILRQHPHEKPRRSDRSPAPAVHAASKAVRQMMRAAYCAFVAAFREAAERLKAGDRLARFPPGAFPPPIPCVLLSG